MCLLAGPKCHRKPYLRAHGVSKWYVPHMKRQITHNTKRTHLVSPPKRVFGPGQLRLAEQIRLTLLPLADEVEIGQFVDQAY